MFIYIFSTFAAGMKIWNEYRKEYAANLRLALPVALSQLGYIAVQFADNAMVGQFGGDDPVPLAAVSFAGAMCYIFYFFCVGITLGLTPVVGEMFVQGHRKRMAASLQSSLVLYPFVGLVVMPLQLACEPLLYHLGQPVEVVDMAVPYYRLMAYSIMPTMLFAPFRQFLEGMGDTKTPMYILIFTNLVNILFNWVFIFGEWGMPEMGVFGAGLSTLLARVLNPILVIAYFVCVPRLRTYMKMFSSKVRLLGNWLELMRIGTPIAAQMVMEMAAFTVTSVMMGWFGAVAISASQIGVTYGNCAWMITLALSSATTIRVAHTFGARDFVSMRRATVASSHLALGWGLTVFMAYVILRGVMPLAFTTNGEVIELASTMLVFYALYQIPDALQGVAVGALRGMQDVKIIARIAFVAYILLNIPTGYIFAFAFGMGANGLVFGYFVGLGVAAVFYWRRLRRTMHSMLGAGKA